MRPFLPFAFVALFVPALAGCPGFHQSPAARAQEAANELNVNARFGRMEMAAEHVSPKAKEQFFDRRKAWGSRIRIADYELAGFRLMKGDDDAEVVVRVAWFRIDQGDLRQTTLRQKWHDFKGDWKLVEEARADGDVGLLGEPIVEPPAPTGPRNVQFPTIRLGAAGASTPNGTATAAAEGGATPEEPTP